MNASLRIRLDEITERWGVKVTNVEVREVNPPPAVQEAMTRQMSAERTRRAQVTEAEGSKAAAILSAEGERQAAITLAEGRQQAAILAAEGERQAANLRSQGLATALQNILAIAPDLDQKTMQLQYLDVLRQVGTSPSTKFIIPMLPRPPPRKVFGGRNACCGSRPQRCSSNSGMPAGNRRMVRSQFGRSNIIHTCRGGKVRPRHREYVAGRGIGRPCRSSHHARSISASRTPRSPQMDGSADWWPAPPLVLSRSPQQQLLSKINCRCPGHILVAFLIRVQGG